LTLVSSICVSAASENEDLIMFDNTSSTFQRRSVDGSITATKINKAGVIIPLTADYDGDGTIDIGYWSPDDSAWTIMRSSDGQQLNIGIDRSLGKENIVPVSGQFDQDKRADIAFFSPNSGTWFLLTSLNGYEASMAIKIKFGTSGDIPVAVDYDGDGITDVAVFRPKTNEWIYRSSLNGTYVSEKFESKPGDVLVPADYTGDGKADIAIYRGEALHGVWFIRDSSTKTLEKLVFGFKNATPIPVDIDGDGIVDPTFYDNGTWYFYDSSQPRLHTIKFGSGECLPVAANIQNYKK
jgi:hypothetical protein